MKFVADYGSPKLIDVRAKTLIFFEEEILLRPQDKNINFFLHDMHATYLHEIAAQCYLGKINDTPVYITALHSLPTEDFLQARSLKVLLEEVDDVWFHLLCRSKQILHWHQTHFYCGRCGGKTRFSTTELAKICTQCEKTIYASYSPAVLVLIQRNHEILLARSPHFRPGHYSVLAGFVEPGESTEQTVHREVEEEVGLKVKNLQLVGTGQWPFPNTFMIAFIAQYDSGEIKMHPQEIEDAQWFTHDKLPGLPYKSSLSRKLIDSILFKT